jgi:glutamyl-tRNA reductase
MFMVDLAVPRDIEPEVGQLSDVYLYSVDDLQDVIDDNLKARNQAAEEAEDIVAHQTEQFVDWVESLSSVDIVRQYRHKMNDLKQQELQRALAQIAAGESAEQVLEEFAYRYSNKVMHYPTRYLRRLNDDKNAVKLQQAKTMLGLDDKAPSRDNAVKNKSKNRI